MTQPPDDTSETDLDYAWDDDDEEFDEDTELLESDGVTDESVHNIVAMHPWPTEDEAAEGQRLGEDIDTEDDEDNGIEEADELLPEEEDYPYQGGEVIQDADEPE